MKKKTSVGLFVENAIFLKGMQSVIEKLDGFEVFVATNAMETFMAALQQAPSPADILVVDINLYAPQFKEIIENIRNILPDVKIMILSNYDHHYSIIKALQQGANGHIAKTAGTQDIHRALLNLKYTGQYVNEEIISNKEDIQHFERYRLLTEKELEILPYLCTEMSFQEIADTLQLHLAIVEGYRDVLFEKLDVSSRVGLAVCARKMGIPINQF